MIGSTTRLFVFLFGPETSRWLSILRIGLGFEVILYAWSLRLEWSYLFSAAPQSVVNRHLTEALIASDSPTVPTLGWLVSVLETFGVGEKPALSLAWVVLFLAGCALVAGLFCRWAAVMAWIVHLAAAKSGGFFAYGVDNFITIGLCYLALAPMPDCFSLDHLWRRKVLNNPDLLRFFRRLLQIHLCLIYFFGGLTKSLGAGWWDGSSLWRALVRPPFNLVPKETLADWADLLPFFGISVFVIEIAYPLLIWPKQTRTIWLGLACTMHAAIGIAMGMYLFGLVMIILNLAAFGSPMGLDNPKPIHRL